MSSPYVQDALQKFGLTPDDFGSLKSVTPTGDKIIFGDDPETAPFPVKVIETKSVGEVKKWIGNTDSPSLSNTPAPTEMDFSKVTPDTTDIAALISAARHYVYHDSATVSHLESAIDKELGPFQVMVASTDTIKIPAGKTVVIEGAKPKAIVADGLIFEGAGSNIEALVNLTMKVQTVVVND